MPKKASASEERTDQSGKKKRKHLRKLGKGYSVEKQKKQQDGHKVDFGAEVRLNTRRRICSAPRAGGQGKKKSGECPSA